MHRLAPALILIAASTAALAAWSSGDDRAPAPSSAVPEFTVFVLESAPEMSRRSDPARSAAYWEEYSAYFRSLAESGALASGSAVAEPASGRVLRVRNGVVSSSAPSPASTAERIGGYFVVRAKSLEDAVAIAAKCPSALSGSVEVRPNVANPAMSRR